MCLKYATPTTFFLPLLSVIEAYWLFGAHFKPLTHMQAQILINWSAPDLLIRFKLV